MRFLLKCWLAATAGFGNPAPPPGPALVIQTAANAVTGILAVSDMLSSFPQETEGGTYYCRGT